jgi:hypothetical protein
LGSGTPKDTRAVLSSRTRRPFTLHPSFKRMGTAERWAMKKKERAVDARCRKAFSWGLWVTHLAYDALTTRPSETSFLPLSILTVSCLPVLGTDDGGAVALPCARRRLVLVEQRRVWWVAGRRERQRAVVRIEVKVLPCRRPELGLTCFLLTSIRHRRRRSRSAAVRPTTTRFGGAAASWVGGG